MLATRTVVLLFSVAMILTTGMVTGQNYPNKPIRIVAGNAGGAGDFSARQIAQGISGPLGQPVIVENRTGVVSYEVTYKAQPDGYTLLVTGAALWVLPYLQKSFWDGVKDFSPVIMIERSPNVLVVHPSVPVKSVKELIAWAKAKPKELNYAGSTIGSVTHLAMELFKSMAGVDIVAVPYKGSAAGMTALIAGEVQVTIVDVGVAAPHAKAGSLRILAVTTAAPSALAPGLPTVAASGLPGYEAGGMSGVFVPAKTSSSIINRLNQEIARVLNRADVKERYLNIGSEIVANSPDEFERILKSELARVIKVIKDAGIKLD